MKPFSRVAQFPVLSGAFSSIIILLSTNSNAIPIGDAYEVGQAEFQASPEFHPRNEVPPVFHQSLHPGSNDEINEEHPIPDYIKKISKSQFFPTHYQQLIEIKPVNQIHMPC